jgi:hypothetical protein
MTTGIDIEAVRLALIADIKAALLPNGDGQPGISGTAIKVFSGWPGSASLNADLAINTTYVSVVPQGDGRNTTRYPVGQRVLVPAAPTLTVSVAAQLVTIGGTVSVPQNVGLLINGKSYVYAVLTGDTLATIATSLAALVAVDISGTTATGPVITVGSTGRIKTARVGASATMGSEVRRQERQVLITVWAPTPALRDQIGAALNIALAQIKFLSLPYGYGGRLIWARDNQIDRTQKQTIYCWDFSYLVEYPTVVISQAAQVLFPITNLTTEFSDFVTTVTI